MINNLEVIIQCKRSWINTILLKIALLCKTKRTKVLRYLLNHLIKMKVKSGKWEYIRGFDLLYGGK